MNAADYAYTQQSRRPATLVACFFCLGFLGFGIYFKAPWFALFGPAIALALSLFAVIFNRSVGCKLVADTLELFSGKWHHLLTLPSIDNVRVKSWSDGAPSVTLDLKSGAQIEVPSACVGSVAAFIEALERRGVGIVQVP